MWCHEGLLVVQLLSQLQTPLFDLIVMAAPTVLLHSVCNLEEGKKHIHKNKQKIELREEDKRWQMNHFTGKQIFLTRLLLIHKSIKIEKGCVWKCFSLRFRLVSFAISGTPKLRLEVRNTAEGMLWINVLMSRSKPPLLTRLPLTGGCLSNVHLWIPDVYSAKINKNQNSLQNNTPFCVLTC